MNIILRTETGSRAYGTDHAGSDRDEMVVYVPTIEETLGIGADPKTVQDHTTDVDTVLYPIRVWARLAAAGNPSVLTPLFTPEPLEEPYSGFMLRQNAALFISKDASHRHLGYMRSQRHQLENSGNRGVLGSYRTELVDKFGFDTKFAYHVIRLGMQGVELMNTGRLVLPLPAGAASMLKGIRDGACTLGEVLDLATEYDEMLGHAIAASTLPEHADPEPINEMLADIQTYEWRRERQ